MLLYFHSYYNPCRYYTYFLDGLMLVLFDSLERLYKLPNTVVSMNSIFFKKIHLLYIHASPVIQIKRIFFVNCKPRLIVSMAFWSKWNIQSLTCSSYAAVFPSNIIPIYFFINQLYSVQVGSLKFHISFVILVFDSMRNKTIMIFFQLHYFHIYPKITKEN